MDTNNKKVDEVYAEKLRQTCRDQIGWKVEEGTRIYNELTEFSKGYSKIKRDTMEVWMIFAMSHGIPVSKPKRKVSTL
jgi:hypothetical protein